MKGGSLSVCSLAERERESVGFASPSLNKQFSVLHKILMLYNVISLEITLWVIKKVVDDYKDY